MAGIYPFNAIRPRNEIANQVAALPYDVYSRKEAKEYVQGKPLSFLNIDRPETAFDDSFDMYSEQAYKSALSAFEEMKNRGIFFKEEKECYYLYELTMNGRVQTGIVACASIDDYINGVIKKHENTREEKEIDRINHVYTMKAQTGPIFLAYRKNDYLKKMIETVKEDKAECEFVSEDGIRHRVFKIDATERIAGIKDAFENIENIYIADGHHRAASAVKVGIRMREEGCEGNEYEKFLSILFSSDELMIMPYNRVVKDLNGLSKEEFFDAISEKFDCEEVETSYMPVSKGTFGLYIENKWYKLTYNGKVETNPVKSLDVSILQDNLLEPILGIKDPRTDKRIDFIGGIRGLAELERRAGTDMKIAFSMYPTSLDELFDVSDANMLMPPKSTWFEPKLRSGLFIHSLE
ncbi:MAG: DUF1015 family protein [Lachnospiraceae bacterium]|nr:DUF1015 family protein [Lachnospiraceae bacterium]